MIRTSILNTDKIVKYKIQVVRQEEH
jgi:hypothetical protein